MKVNKILMCLFVLLVATMSVSAYQQSIIYSPTSMGSFYQNGEWVQVSDEKVNHVVDYDRGWSTRHNTVMNSFEFDDWVCNTFSYNEGSFCNVKYDTFGRMHFVTSGSRYTESSIL